jgi:hypothetical protein
VQEIVEDRSHGVCLLDQKEHGQILGKLAQTQTRVLSRSIDASDDSMLLWERHG